MKTIKILAIDQATKLGYSIFDNGKLIDYGTKDFSKYKNDVDIKLNKIKNFFIELIEKTTPILIVIEGIQYQSNFHTYAQLARLQGLLIDTCVERELLYQVVAPVTWRTIGIKGKNRAEQKKSSIQFVKENFNLDVNDDVADAVNMGYYATKNIKIEKDDNINVKEK